MSNTEVNFALLRHEALWWLLTSVFIKSYVYMFAVIQIAYYYYYTYKAH